MNEKVEDLILEHLPAIRADTSSLKEEMMSVRGEMLTVRRHMVALLETQNVQSAEVASIKVRLDRIEQRLDLVN